MKKTRKTVPTAPDMLLAMKGAFYDLWLDTEERPRIPAAHRQIRKFLKRHLDDWEDAGAEREFIRLQREIDRGLRKDDIDGIIIPAQNELRKLYEQLFEAIFCVRPRRGE